MSNSFSLFRNPVFHDLLIAGWSNFSRPKTAMDDLGIPEAKEGMVGLDVHYSDKIVSL